MTRVAQEAERLGFNSIWLYDHFHTVPDAGAGDRLRVLDEHGRAGPRHAAHPHRADGHLQQLPQPGPAGEDGLDGGRDEPRAARSSASARAGTSTSGAPTATATPTARPACKHAGRGVARSSRRCGPRTMPTFEGKYYQVDGAINEPKGVQKPHPPIWIGGGGEKVTLKLVAQVRRRLQLRRLRPGRLPPQGRRAAPALRDGGPRLRRHPAHQRGLHLPDRPPRKPGRARSAACRRRYRRMCIAASWSPARPRSSRSSRRWWMPGCNTSSSISGIWPTWSLSSALPRKWCRRSADCYSHDRE